MSEPSDVQKKREARLQRQVSARGSILQRTTTAASILDYYLRSRMPKEFNAEVAAETRTAKKIIVLARIYCFPD